MDHHHHHHRNLHIRSDYTSGERIKQHRDHNIISPNNNAASSGERVVTPKNNHNSGGGSGGGGGGGVPSPRPGAHRRYKLLKDVMC